MLIGKFRLVRRASKRASLIDQNDGEAEKEKEKQKQREKEKEKEREAEKEKEKEKESETHLKPNLRAAWRGGVMRKSTADIDKEKQRQSEEKEKEKEREAKAMETHAEESNAKSKELEHSHNSGHRVHFQLAVEEVCCVLDVARFLICSVICRSKTSPALNCHRENRCPFGSSVLLFHVVCRGLLLSFLRRRAEEGRVRPKRKQVSFQLVCVVIWVVCVLNLVIELVAFPVCFQLLLSCSVIVCRLYGPLISVLCLLLCVVVFSFGCVVFFLRTPACCFFSRRGQVAVRDGVARCAVCAGTRRDGVYFARCFHVFLFSHAHMRSLARQPSSRRRCRSPSPSLLGLRSRCTSVCVLVFCFVFLFCFSVP